jgi:hypothetical protein
MCRKDRGKGYWVALFLCVILRISGAPNSSFAQEFPVVLRAQDLRSIGIAVSAPHFRNKCYYYGDGGYLISLADELLSKFISRGFTLQTACLGLVSESRFDPENGRRLPTYIVVDTQLIAQDQRQFGQVISPGAVSNELPSDLPNCFKNGNPYTDCTFRYGRKTGKALAPAETQIYQQLGSALDNAASRRRDTDGGRCPIDRQGGPIQGFMNCGYIHLLAQLPEDAVSERLRRYASVSFWHSSPTFSRKYGYALDAEGGAQPTVTVTALRQALDGVNRQQLTVNEIRRRLSPR